MTQGTASAAPSHARQAGVVTVTDSRRMGSAAGGCLTRQAGSAGTCGAGWLAPAACAACNRK
jgi:hypothetical protein